MILWFYEILNPDLSPLPRCCGNTKVVPVQRGGKFTIRYTVINTDTWKFNIDLAVLKSLRDFSPTWMDEAHRWEISQLCSSASTWPLHSLIYYNHHIKGRSLRSIQERKRYSRFAWNEKMGFEAGDQETMRQKTSRKKRRFAGDTNHYNSKRTVKYLHQQRAWKLQGKEQGMKSLKMGLYSKKRGWLSAFVYKGN